MASHMGAKMAPSHPDFLLSLTLAEGALNKLYVVASETLLIGRLKVAYAPSEVLRLSKAKGKLGLKGGRGVGLLYACLRRKICFSGRDTQSHSLCTSDSRAIA